MKNIITFPNMGLKFTISPVAFSIGNKSVYWYALIILAGFLLGILIASIKCEKRGLTKDNVIDIAIWGIIAGIIGARIYYVIFSYDEFKGDFLSVFRIWEGGLAIYGGIIGAVISTAIYCKIKKLNILNAFDVCCVGLLLGQAVGRWGNFVNCEVYGRHTYSLFCMSINGGTPVHPLFLYESAWSLLGVILLCIFRDKKKRNGQVFCGYVFWYALGRMFLEGMRDKSYVLYIADGLPGVSQILSFCLVILSVAAFIFLSLRKQPTAQIKAEEHK